MTGTTTSCDDENGMPTKRNAPSHDHAFYSRDPDAEIVLFSE